MIEYLSGDPELIEGVLRLVELVCSRGTAPMVIDAL
jgi:hypothetical protein